jgi:hypothetical protein
LILSIAANDSAKGNPFPEISRIKGRFNRIRQVHEQLFHLAFSSVARNRHFGERLLPSGIVDTPMFPVPPSALFLVLLFYIAGINEQQKYIPDKATSVLRHVSLAFAISQIVKAYRATILQ